MTVEHSIAFFSALFWAMGANTALPMFERLNRPIIFQSEAGEAVFSVSNFIISVGIISLAIWTFINITWYIAMAFLFGGAIVGGFLSRIPPVAGNGLFVIVSAIAIFLLNLLVWRIWY